MGSSLYGCYVDDYCQTGKHDCGDSTMCVYVGPGVYRCEVSSEDFTGADCNTKIKHRGGGSMRATILPSAVILTKAHRAAVNMMAKGCIVARVLPLRCFFTIPNYIFMSLYINACVFIS